MHDCLHLAACSRINFYKTLEAISCFIAFHAGNSYSRSLNLGVDCKYLVSSAFVINYRILLLISSRYCLLLYGG